MFARAGRIGTLILLALLVPACASSLRTGEVELLKIAPADATPRADRSSATYLLKGRFFSLSDNAHRILDAFMEFDHVGGLRILKETSRIVEEALRAAGRAEAAGDASRGEIARLRRLAERAGQLNGRLARKIGAVDPAASVVRIAPFSVLEMAFDRYVERLDSTQRFLDHLRDSVADVRSERSQPLLTGGPTFELIFEIAGAPLHRDAWTPGKGDQGHRLKDAVYDDLYRRLDDPLDTLFKALHAIPDGRRPRSLVDEAEQVRAAAARLKPVLRRVLEWALDLSYAVRRRESAVAVMDCPCGSFHLRAYDAHLDLMNLEIHKALREVRLLLQQLREPMRQIAATYITERVEVESLAAELAQITRRNYSRPIVVPKTEGASPPHLTVLLKTLFVRFLDEDASNVEPEKRCAELLVTCAVKHAGSAEDAVYPLIFEKDFAPGHFVNRLERIAYGPYPYRGEFLDFRFSVVELDDLDNAAILSGIANATAAVGAFNPELAVLSPAVTAIFGTLIREISKNDTELDASFTFPGEQGAGKPDVDMLINETGHYVVLKRENRYRPERLGQAAQELIYRKLIYNAEDGKLYWRRSFSDARSNFTADNLFKQQTYAVFVVTDEYVQGDELGAALRKQVGRALGEARAREIVPDLAQSAKLVQRYHDLRKEKREFKRTGPELGEAERLAAGKQLMEQQEELWRDSTELQKQLLIEALYDRATDDAKERLGKDLEKWKRADFEVDSDGRLHLKSEAAQLDERRAKVPGAAAESMFVKPVGDGREWQYHLRGADDRVLPAAVKGSPSKWEGLGSMDENGDYTSPANPAQPWVVVRAVGTTKGRSDAILERRVTFMNDASVKARLGADGAPVTEGSRSQAILHERTLLKDAELTLELLDAPDPMVWRVVGKTVAKDKPAAWDSSALASASLDGMTLTLKLKAGAVREPVEEFSILAVHEPFLPIFERGAPELYPHLKATLRLVNPLTFEPGIAEIEVDAQGKPMRIRPVKALVKDAPQDLQIDWTFEVGGIARGKTTAAPDALTLKAAWFEELLGKAPTGMIEVKGSSPRFIPLQARLPYRRVLQD